MYFKFLRDGRRSPFTGFTWPSGREITTETAEHCRSGFHACRAADLPYWLSDELWAIELHGQVAEAAHKVVARRARLLERVDGWNAESIASFTTACLARTITHAAEELRLADRRIDADRLAEAATDGAVVKPLAADIGTTLAGSRHRHAGKLCRYVEDAVDALPLYPAATLAYIAARAAGQRSDADQGSYLAERRWQATWLAENVLGLVD